MSETMNTESPALFGQIPGKSVSSYTLSNANGLEMDVIDYGATITSLRIPVKDSAIDVVLGFDNVANYADSFHLPSAPYFGSIVGRYAGRIKDGKFTLNGHEFQLNKNNGGNSLHGGHSGFSQKLWTLKSHDESSITFTYDSPDGDENLPGDLHVEIEYSLTNADELVVSYSATSSEDTIINLTQHSYFNLDGHDQDVSKHELGIRADHTLETIDMIPTGKFVAVDGTDFDFNSKKQCPTSIDKTFVLDEKPGPVAVLSGKSGIKMRVYTDQPALHIYVGGNCFGKIKGKDNADYHPLSGICFEAQNFPDAPNHSNFPNSVLKKGETYQQKTIFQFDTK